VEYEFLNSEDVYVVLDGVLSEYVVLDPKEIFSISSILQISERSLNQARIGVCTYGGIRKSQWDGYH
jgi:hypothetical protein